MDVDYFTFVKGKDATDPEPIGGDTTTIAGVKLSTGTAMAAYGIYDVSGMFLGRIEAAGLSDVKAKASELVRNGGMFIAKSVNGGKVLRFAVTK